MRHNPRKLLWFEIIKVMIAVKNKFVVLFITVFGTLPFTVVRTVFYVLLGRIAML